MLHELPTITLKIKGKKYNLWVAHDSKSKKQGLAGIDGIGDNEGMVFPYGSNGSSWKWASVKSRPVTEEEQTNLTLKTSFKTDMNTMKLFEEKEYVQALDYIGALEG